MEPFPDVDIAIEILSRLPPKTIAAFKCTAKRWNRLLSDSSFLHIHDKRSKDIHGLLIQQLASYMEVDIDLVNHITITKKESIKDNTFLDFLPEKVVLVASSKGMLCCRSCIYSERYESTSTSTQCKGIKLKKKEKENLSLYICNLTTREWVSIRPKEDDATLVFGLAFHPFSSSSPTGSSFQLVNLQHVGSSGNTYSFAIYSSKTRKWEMSREVFEFNSYAHPSKVVFCNGRFHWLTKSNRILTFDLEKQTSKFLKLPGKQPYGFHGCEYGICLSESEGCFHYLCAFRTELYVWILRDYEESAWELKYHFLTSVFYKQHPSVFESLRDTGECYCSVCYHIPGSFVILAFYDDVLYLRFFMQDYPIFSYDFKTGTLMKRCGGAHIGVDKYGRDYISFPYRVSLLPLSSQLPLLRGCHTKRNKKQRLME